MSTPADTPRLRRRLAAPFARLGRRLTALRLRLRDFEAGILCCAALVGTAVGFVTLGLHEAMNQLHVLDFALPEGARLSAQTTLDPWRLALVPAAGGAILAALTALLQKLKPAELVDPIEANALYGGRLSLRESARLAGLTLVSNAAGASVGMEAGYSQMGAGLFSSVAQYLQLKREDRRLMVSAGAAAGIAAAFGAPLAGAFYGFELVHGSYTSRGLAPVTVAAMAGAIVSRLFGADTALFTVSGAFDFPPAFFALFAILGIAAAGLGILTMQAVTWAERSFRAARVPHWARPAIGGAVLSLLALGSPQVLGSGHGGIQWHLDARLPLLMVAALLLGKLVASAVSLGAGFRGGLFSSSLFLGALLGATFVQGLGLIDPGILPERTAFMLVGMASVGAAIIGAPFTMIFLVLEGTGDFPVTMGVVVGVLVASTVVRQSFGYSFSTWRFHLRGLTLRGAHDIAWAGSLTAGRLLRADARTVPAGLPLVALREAVPLGSRKFVFAVTEGGRYSGLIDMTVAHDPEISDLADTLVAEDLTTVKRGALYPEDGIDRVLDAFGATRSETLPVVASAENPQVLGYVTEAYCLKRYAQELERRRSDELGMTY